MISQKSAANKSLCAKIFNPPTKVAWAKGVTTRFGGSMNSIGVAWQYTWF